MSGYRMGVDVSQWQGNIDWERAKAAGIEFAMLRAGFGQNSVDPQFKRKDVYKRQVWDGESLTDVAGYRPMVAVSVPPAGGGTALEQINKLCPQRRARFSPDGTEKVFVLPEKGDRKSTRLNSSHLKLSRMPSSA